MLPTAAAALLRETEFQVLARLFNLPKALYLIL
jgi:hypothetical protein